MAIKNMSNLEFKSFVNMIRLKIVGTGSEGVCFKSSVDGKAYKLFHIISDENVGQEYDVNEIITTDDIKLESFAFPEELYVVDGIFKGYKSEYCNNNIFNDEFLSEPTNIVNINFKKLLKAYYKMKKDVIKLSSKNIRIYDLSYNLLFDGENLTGVDTCGYYKSENALEHNLSCLDSAITDMFEFYFEDILKESGVDIDFNLSVEDLLKTLDLNKKQIKSFIKEKIW